MGSHGDKHHFIPLIGFSDKVYENGWKTVFEHEKSFGGEMFCKNVKDNFIKMLRRNCLPQMK